MKITRLNVDVIAEKVVRRYVDDGNVVGIMLIGSAARGTFDQYSDVDFWIVLKKRSDYSRQHLTVNSIPVELLFDTVAEIKKYFKEERASVRRNASLIFSEGKILYKRGREIELLQRQAKRNLKIKTRLTSNERTMHQYSLDDFFTKGLRAYKKKDFISFHLYVTYIIANSLELFLKVHGEYFRKTNDTLQLIRARDRQYYRLLEQICNSASHLKKVRLIKRFVKYSQKISVGSLPKNWEIRHSSI